MMAGTRRTTTSKRGFFFLSIRALVNNPFVKAPAMKERGNPVNSRANHQGTEASHVGHVAATGQEAKCVDEPGLKSKCGPQTDVWSLDEFLPIQPIHTASPSGSIRGVHLPPSLLFPLFWENSNLAGIQIQNPTCDR